MIVYVESNFVLELAYLQDEHAACQELLDLAAAKKLELVLPAFSLTEPYGTVEARVRERTRLHESLDKELRQLSRSQNYATNKASFDEVTAVLVRSIEDQRTSLDSVIRQMSVARVLPMTFPIVWDSIDIKKEQTLGLSPQDAFAYTSILNDLTKRPACFITRDKGFNNPDIEEELAGHDCKLFWKFETGLSYAKSQLHK